MSNWDIMDKKAWKKSEVMSELENLVKKAEGLEKSAQATPGGMGALTQNLKNVSTLAGSAAKSLKELNQAAKGMAEDHLKENQDMVKDQDLELEQKTKEEILEELTALAEDAISKKDYKLAYKIERTIDSIVFED